MSTLQHFPVVVVGAGPTGLVTANLLGFEKIQTLIIEKHESTVQAPRAVSIDDEALRTIQSFGLVEKVLADITLDYGSWYFTPNGHCFAKVEPQTREYGYPRRNAFHQPRLEATLLEGTKRFEHLQTWFGHTLLDLNQNEKVVHLNVLSPSGEKIQISCDYLAACDGGKSTVRQLLGVPFEGSSYNQRWLIIDTLNTSNSFRQTKVFCDPDRPAITLPGPNGSRRFEFMLHDHENDKVAEDMGFVEKLLLTHGETRNPTIIRRQVYTFQACAALKWKNGRVFLLGDAAHLTPPFAGQGMNSGIRDAHNFAWKTGLVVKDKFPESWLDTYELERKLHAKALIDMAVMMGRFMMPSSRLKAWIIQRGMMILKCHPCSTRLHYPDEIQTQPFFQT